MGNVRVVVWRASTPIRQVFKSGHGDKGRQIEGNFMDQVRFQAFVELHHNCLQVHRAQRLQDWPNLAGCDSQVALFYKFDV